MAKYIPVSCHSDIQCTTFTLLTFRTQANTHALKTHAAQDMVQLFQNVLSACKVK